NHGRGWLAVGEQRDAIGLLRMEAAAKGEASGGDPVGDVSKLHLAAAPTCAAVAASCRSPGAAPPAKHLSSPREAKHRRPRSPAATRRSLRATLRHRHRSGRLWLPIPAARRPAAALAAVDPGYRALPASRIFR